MNAIGTRYSFYRHLRSNIGSYSEVHEGIYCIFKETKDHVTCIWEIQSDRRRVKHNNRSYEHLQTLTSCGPKKHHNVIHWCHDNPRGIHQEPFTPEWIMRFLPLHPRRMPTSCSRKLTCPNVNMWCCGKLNRCNVQDDRWIEVQFPVGAEISSSSHPDRLLWSTLPPFQSLRRHFPSGKGAQSCSCLLISILFQSSWKSRALHVLQLEVHCSKRALVLIDVLC